MYSFRVSFFIFGIIFLSVISYVKGRTLAMMVDHWLTDSLRKSTILEWHAIYLGLTVSYALVNETTRSADPTIYDYKPLNCNGTISLDQNQFIYFRFTSLTYFDDATCFIYSSETNLYEEASWEFYRSNDHHILYTVGKIDHSKSLYSFSFTAYADEVFTCEVNIISGQTFPIGAILGIAFAVLLILVGLVSILWMYCLKKQSNVGDPSLMPQQSQDIDKSHYYENVVFMLNNSKLVKK